MQTLRPVSNNTSHRLAMRPQINQVKRHLTDATSHDQLSVSNKLFHPVAFVLKQLVLKIVLISPG